MLGITKNISSAFTGSLREKNQERWGEIGIIQNAWFWPYDTIMFNEALLFPNSRITVLFCIAGFRPGSRATFVSAKVAKTIDAPPGLMK